MVGGTTTVSRALNAHWLWLGLFALVFAPTAAWLWERWTLSVWHNGHGVFVLPVAAYLIWENLRRDPVTEVRTSPWGFAFLLPGLGLLALDAAIRTQILSALALVVCLPGLSLLLLGERRTWSLALPLGLAAFMIPIPAGPVAELYLALRTISAWGATQLLELWGIPVFREATTLTLPRNLVEVVDACSGFSTLYASLFLGVILADRTPSWARRFAILGCAPVLAIASNMVRVFALILLVHYSGADLLETSLHELSGMATFAVVLVALFVIAEWRSRPASSA